MIPHSELSHIERPIMDGPLLINGPTCLNPVNGHGNSQQMVGLRMVWPRMIPQRTFHQRKIPQRWSLKNDPSTKHKAIPSTDKGNLWPGIHSISSTQMLDSKCNFLWEEYGLQFLLSICLLLIVGWDQNMALVDFILPSFSASVQPRGCTILRISAWVWRSQLDNG